MLKSETKKRYGPKQFSDVLKSATAHISERYGYVGFRIISDWWQIVGTRLSSISVPISVTFAQSEAVNGVLTIGVENPGFGLEIQSNSNMIIEMIARHFGYRVVGSIKLKVVPKGKLGLSQAVPIEKHTHLDIPSGALAAVNAVDDNEIREILREIAGRVPL